MKNKITLKEALAKGKLEQFIKERDSETYKPAVFNAAIEKLAGKSKVAPVTSSPAVSGNYSDKKTQRRKRKDA